MFEVDKILDHKKNNKYGYTLYVKWQDFGPECNTWEPIKAMYESVPFFVEEYLKSKQLEIEFDDNDEIIGLVALKKKRGRKPKQKENPEEEKKETEPKAAPKRGQARSKSKGKGAAPTEEGESSPTT